MKDIHIYTDGACSGNPGPGGCAYVTVEDGKETDRHCEGFRRTTNNRMEIKAAILALKAAAIQIRLLEGRDTDIKVTVFSDSQLVVNTLSLSWARKANHDLWKEIDQALLELDRLGAAVSFSKVKGHAGDQWNDLADRLAVSASKAPVGTDTAYENISPLPGSTVPCREPEVKEVRLLGFVSGSGRKVEIDLTNGETVTITACCNGFEQTGATQKEYAVTVDIAWRFVAWLNGKSL